MFFEAAERLRRGLVGAPSERHEGTMRETDFLVAFDGVDWCVLEAHTIHGWYPTKEEAVRCAAAAARRSRAGGVYARVVVKLQQAA